MEFIFPPSNDIPLNFSNALTYIIGQGLTLYWTEAPAGAAVSILLWQADPNTGVSVGDMEYVIQSVVNRTQHDWTIRPGFNLTYSNLFQLAIYREGETEPDDFSRYFYLVDTINSASVSSSSVSSSSSPRSPNSASTASSSSFAATSSTPSSPPTTTTAPTPVPIPSAAPFVNSFPTSAKIGIGVGIPVALVLGLIVGFLLFRRYKNKDVKPPPTSDTQATEQYKYGQDSHPLNNNSSYYAPPLNEAPPESLVELEPQHAAGVHAHKAPNNGTVSARYEM